MSQPSLTGVEDRYSGIIVDPESLPEDASHFEGQLKTELNVWRAEVRNQHLMEIDRRA